MAQMLYKLQCLSAPSENFIKMYKSIVRDFIWNRKKSKISIDRLERNYEAGGLKLVNLEAKNKSIKFKMMNNYINEDNMVMHILSNIINIPKQQLPVANISTKQCNTLFAKNIHRSRYTYIKELYLAWASFNFTSPSNKENLLEQPIWYNSYIKTAGKMHGVRMKTLNEDMEMCNLHFWIG